MASKAMDAGTAVSYLQLLPMELWLACWTMCSPRQLRRLSLVCRLFRAICFPQLLQNQNLDAAALRLNLGGYNWTDRLHKLHRAAVRLDRLAPDHATSIRSWKFIAIQAGHSATHQLDYIQNIRFFDTVYDRVLTTFTSTLGFYKNLHTLHLQQLTIDAAMRNTLLSLSALEDLTVWNCPIVARDGVPLTVMVFTIRGTASGSNNEDTGATEGPLRVVSADSLRRLHIDATDNSVALISGFGPAKRFAHLVHLSLHELIDVDLFLSLLKQCPQLKSLEILSMHKIAAASVPQYLSPDTVPLLQNLSGPWQLLGYSWIIALTSRGCLFPSCLFPSLEGCGLSRHWKPPSLFPALRELTINISPSSDGIVSRYPAPPDTSLDTRCPVLCDDDAFHNLPTDDISDAEDEPAPHVALVTPKHPIKDEWTPGGDFYTIVEWITSARILLPDTLEVLRLQVEGRLSSRRPRGGFGTYMAATRKKDQEYQLIAALSGRYPLLHEVQIGYAFNCWKRIEGPLWERLNFRIQVL
ncbi:hypothetical protein B0H13DRAFT_1880439 [Mycena leptocephala]|nr:hypothetical protein B0H13DRAFT_1880439 [Mycena leptocephala]